MVCIHGRTDSCGDACPIYAQDPLFITDGLMGKVPCAKYVCPVCRTNASNTAAWARGKAALDPALGPCNCTASTICRHRFPDTPVEACLFHVGSHQLGPVVTYYGGNGAGGDSGEAVDCGGGTVGRRPVGGEGGEGGRWVGCYPAGSVPVLSTLDTVMNLFGG